MLEAKLDKVWHADATEIGLIPFFCPLSPFSAQWTTPFGVAAAPSIVVDDVTGQGVVAWSEYQANGEATSAYAQRLHADGTADGERIDAVVPSGVEPRRQKTVGGRSAYGRCALHANLAICV